MTLPCGNHVARAGIDQPAVALPLLAGLTPRWLPRGEGAAWAVRHGLRTLVKQGDPRALDVLGVTADVDIRLTALTVDRDTVAIGDAVTFILTIELAGTAEADAVIDYRVGCMGANGRRGPNVFKLTRRRLTPGRPTTITRRHRFDHVSIRRVHPGPHTIDIQVNGHILGTVHIDLIDPTTTDH
jgi:hypothetical protein